MKKIALLLAIVVSFNVHGDIYVIGGYKPATAESGARDNLIPGDVVYIGTKDINAECSRLQKDPATDWSSDIVLLQERSKEYTYATCGRNKLVKNEGIKANDK